MKILRESFSWKELFTTIGVWMLIGGVAYVIVVGVKFLLLAVGAE